MCVSTRDCHTKHPSKGFCHHISNVLEELNLPQPEDLLISLPSKLAWSAHIKSLLYLEVYELFLSSSSHMSTLSDVSINVTPNLKGKPSKILSVFKDNISLGRLHQSRLRLILHCSDLQSHTTSFRTKPATNTTCITHRNSICPLCNWENEDAFHFLMSCPTLQSVRSTWFPYALPRELYDHIMGIVWISSDSYQEHLTCFVAALRAARQAALLTSN